MDNRTEYKKICEFWQRRCINTGRELSDVLNGKFLELIYHNGKIENSAITLDDTREIYNTGCVSDFTGTLRTLHEIENGIAAVNLVVDAFDRKQQITENFVKELHFCLTKNTYDARRIELGEQPGEYRKNEFAAGPTQISSNAEDVPSEIEELLSEIADSSITGNENVLSAAAYFHAKFETIHPFADGNGRTGRLLMNYFLITHSAPPVIIFSEDKNLYYIALEAWKISDKISPLKKLLTDQTVKTWQKELAFMRECEDKKQG